MGGDRILVCDVGGTRLRVAVVEPGGSIVSKKVIPTPKDDPGALARTMRLVQKTAATIAGAVVGVPGPVDYSHGEVLKLPNLPNWEGTVSGGALNGELGMPVLLANDADLAALGEHRWGAGRGSEDMLYVTSSTGVGAGVIIGERLLHGRLSRSCYGRDAGELGLRNRPRPRRRGGCGFCRSPSCERRPRRRLASWERSRSLRRWHL